MDSVGEQGVPLSAERVTAATTVKVHTALAALWLLLALGTTVWAFWDPENHYLLAWVIFMSAYANAASHLAGRAGAGPSEGQDG